MNYLIRQTRAGSSSPVLYCASPFIHLYLLETLNHLTHSTIWYTHTNTGVHTGTHTGTHTKAHAHAHTGTHRHTHMHTQSCSMPPYFCSVSSAFCLLTFAHSPLLLRMNPQLRPPLLLEAFSEHKSLLSVPTMYVYRIPWILYSN